MRFNQLHYNKKTFILTHSYFGCKKSKLNFSLNTFILGFNDNFSIINPELFIEHSKRIFLFCFNFILNQSHFFFIHLNYYVKRYSFFMVLRCLESVLLKKWINGLLTNSLWSKPAAIFISKVKNFLTLQEAFIKNLPLILINDGNVLLNKNFYLIFGNDSSKKFLYFYFKNLSNFILLAKLYKVCVKF